MTKEVWAYYYEPVITHSKYEFLRNYVAVNIGRQKADGIFIKNRNVICNLSGEGGENRWVQKVELSDSPLEQSVHWIQK